MPPKTEASNFKCPFTGRPLEIYDLGGAFIAVSRVAGDDAWLTTLFATKAELVMFLAANLKNEKPGGPLTKVSRVCPLFGSPIQVVKTGNHRWLAMSHNAEGQGYTTTAFWTERHLDFFLSTRAGVPPVFSNGDVEVREREKPPPPDVLGEEMKSRQTSVVENAKVAIDKLGLESGILVPTPYIGAGRNPRKRG